MRYRPGILALLLITSLSACGRDSVTLGIAMPDLPVDREIAQDLVEMLDDESGIRLELVGPALSEAEAIDALATGRADLALVSNSMPYTPGVSAIIPMYPTILHIAYREGRDTASGRALLTGARVFAGPEGSASRRIYEQLIERLELSDGDFNYADDLQAPVDVVVLFMPFSPERLAEHPELRLFSFGSADDVGRGSVVDAATLLNPHFRPFVIPEGAYGEATPDPTLTLAVDRMLIARNDLDASAVYNLVLTLLRNRPALAARHPGLFEHLVDDFDMSRSTFAVHEGTQAYLQREAPTVYERYSGIAEVVVTLFVALVSASIAGLRILQRRKKNRIDEFYSATIAIRNSITRDATNEQRAAASQQIRDLQDRAFNLLVSEKLAADDSFRIFITLSQDVLRQVEDTGRPGG